MKKLIIGVAGAALLITGTMLVVAQRSKGHDRQGFSHRGFGGGGMFLKGLDLTDEQRMKVQEIFASSRSVIEPLREQSREARTKIRGLGHDGNFDQAQVEALAAEQSGIMAKMIVEREKAKAQVFAILTDEQKAKAAEMRSKFGEKFRSRDHKFKPHVGEEF